MSQLDPFRPVGNSQTLLLTTAAQTITLSTLGGYFTSVRIIVNMTSSNWAYVAFGSSSVTAVVGTSTAAFLGMPIYAADTNPHIFAVSGINNYISVAGSSAGQIYVTPGVGGYV
jgi:hypothetical protein